MMGKGDHIVIQTPGGGAWGIPKEKADQEEYRHKYTKWHARGSLVEREALQGSF
jgi:5-oxoprolinase (ATP-hydrolysing)